VFVERDSLAKEDWNSKNENDKKKIKINIEKKAK